MSKVYTIPEWFTKLKAYKKYDLEKYYDYFCLIIKFQFFYKLYKSC